MSSTVTIEFTATAIKAAVAAAAAGTSSIIRDTKMAGLILRRRREGWTFEVEKKVKGTIIREVIGPLISTGLVEARRKATDIVSAAARIDPEAERARAEAAARAAELAAWSLQDALDFHAAKIGMRESSKATSKGALKNFQAHIPVPTLGQIEQQHILEAFQALATRLAPTTVRTQSKILISIVEAWRLAHPVDIRPAFNVATEALRRSGRKLILPRAKVRNERLNAADLPAWIKACRALTEEVGPVLAVPYQAAELLLLTGMREQECLRLAWTELEDDDARVRLPPERVKNGTEFCRPLGRRAREIIAARRAVAEEGSRWVFQSWKMRGRPLEDLRKALEKIAERGAKRMRAHDLRRSFAAASQRAGVDGLPQKLLLGHAIGDVTEGYVGTLEAELPAMAQLVENKILEGVE